MERIKLLSSVKIGVMLSVLLVPSIALAMIIYDWQDANDPNSSIIGTMVFADGVDFGDVVDPLSSQLAQFSFSNQIHPDWSLSDFAFGNFLVPDAAGVDLDPSGFAIPDTGKKAAAKKTTGGTFSFQRDDALLDFSIAGFGKKVAKKKAAGDAGDAPIDPFPLWSWTSTIQFDCPPDTACKKTASPNGGDGFWVLRSGPVSVPEPTTFLLTLSGLVMIVSLFRRARRLLA